MIFQGGGGLDPLSSTPPLWIRAWKVLVEKLTFSILCVFEDLKGAASEVKTSLLFFRSLFPVEKFEHRLPPIVMKHQLYSLHSDRSLVDKQIVSTYMPLDTL